MILDPSQTWFQYVYIFTVSNSSGQFQVFIAFEGYEPAPTVADEELSWTTVPNLLIWNN